MSKNLQEILKINSNQFNELSIIIKNLVKAFKSLDASTIEINPLVINKEGKFVLLDAKINLDDNALFRHPELEKLKDFSEENPLELEAFQNDMNYVKLDGHSDYSFSFESLLDGIVDISPNNLHLLVIGDARNNYRAIEDKLLSEINEKFEKIYWLNPEKKEYWSTGDSIINHFEPICES